MNTLIKDGDVAAFVYEPLVQGAAAMRMHEPEHINELLAIAKKPSPRSSSLTQPQLPIRTLHILPRLIPHSLSRR